MIIDFKGYRVILKDKTIYLTKININIFELLYKNKNKVVTYNEIIYKIYKTEPDEYLKSSIRQHISLLKKKLNKYITIKNIYNTGYIMIIEEDLK